MSPFIIENQIFEINYTYLFLVFILGTIAGSFSHAFADGCINNKKIFRRSTCNHCNQSVSWFHLIPIFSFFFLKGKCIYCKKDIDIDTLLFELFFGSIFMIYFIYLDVWEFFIFGLLSIFLGVIFETDRKKMFIDIFSLFVIIIISLLYTFWQLSDYRIIIEKIFLFSFGWLMIFLISYSYFMIKGIHGFGSGDKWLLATISTMFSYQEVIFIFLFSCIIGSIIGISIIIYKKSLTNIKLPFGSFICFVSMICPLL